MQRGAHADQHQEQGGADGGLRLGGTGFQGCVRHGGRQGEAVLRGSQRQNIQAAMKPRAPMAVMPPASDTAAVMADISNGPPPPPRSVSSRQMPRNRVRSEGGEARSEEHTSELQSRENLVCRLLLEK